MVLRFVTGDVDAGVKAHGSGKIEGGYFHLCLAGLRSVLFSMVSRRI
jgi:hypothetical protein